MKYEVPEDDHRLLFVPLDELVTPPSGLIHCVKDNWWVWHPERGAAFWLILGYQRRMLGRAPQCNRKREIAESFTRMYPWAEVRLIPEAFYPANRSI